jgi:carbohydrate kinase (thermoresistant glucokinase family)
VSNIPDHEAPRARTILVMGVCGCGKSTVGRLLASRLDLPFFDADDFHSPENIALMREGRPLDDNHRAPWLAALNQLLRQHQTSGGLILACSALKESYRQTLTDGIPEPVWIYLRGTRDLLLSRLTARQNHFMPSSLLDSQLATLEEPPYAIVCDVAESAETIVSRLVPELLPG